MTFGLQIDERAAVTVLDRAAEGGVTFLDTADAYPLGGGVDLAGTTEEIVGRWLKDKRHQFVLATKVYGRTGPQAWDFGNSRRHIMDAIDASLRRLGTHYIDLYQLHQEDPETPVDETLVALDDLVRAGKVRYIGCSNFLAYRLARAIGRSETLGLARFDSVQPRYNLLFREFERELFPLCLEEGVGVIPYNPLAGGMLSGKHPRGQPPAEGTRFTISNAGDVPGTVLARARVRHGRRVPKDRQGSRDETSDAGDRLGLEAAGRDCSHHRREPSRAARGHSGSC